MKACPREVFKLSYIDELVFYYGKVQQRAESEGSVLPLSSLPLPKRREGVSPRLKLSLIPNKFHLYLIKIKSIFRHMLK